MTPVGADALREALRGVLDPEIRRSIVDLGMVDDVSCDDGKARARILLTVAGCPMRSTIEADVRAALLSVDGVAEAVVELDVMSPEQRRALRDELRGPRAANTLREPDSLTRIYAVASGKGGVGKSSITSNLAASLAAAGVRVGVLDADVYGFSIPRMLGATGKPTKVEDMIMPQPAHGAKVMSIGMLVPEGKPVAWRGPMLHRALEQFVDDVCWGDLDVLLLDLPPGTGDIAISTAQLLPRAELLVVTTPQAAAAEVAERAGALAATTGQRVAGVIENMSWLETPDGGRLEVFGSGGGEAVAARLTETLGTEVPLLGQVPLDPALREGADAGEPVVVSAPCSPAACALTEIASVLIRRRESLAGVRLPVSPV